MAKDRVKIDNKKLTRIMRDSPGVVSDALRATALEMVSDVVLSFGSSAPGATYTRRGIEHTASVSGSPPNVDTGALRASIRMEKKSDHEFWVTDGVLYGYYLETGTSRMKPRPFMRPAFERARKRFADRFKDMV